MLKAAARFSRSGTLLDEAAMVQIALRVWFLGNLQRRQRVEEHTYISVKANN
jgi:hypothetical protein